MLYVSSDSNLVKELKKKQVYNRLSDIKFSAILGIGRTTWRQTKFRERPVGLTLLRAVARTYPELNEEILTFLRDGDGN